MRAAARATAAGTVKLFIWMVLAVSVAEGRLVTVPGVICFSCTALMWKVQPRKTVLLNNQSTWGGEMLL